MGLRLPDRWIWDFWLAHDGHQHHLFYLQAPRSLGDPELRHWHASIGHAVSTDLSRWRVLPDALTPAPAGAWDDYTTWTGSVVHHDDRWWMFYTGTNRAEGGRVQRVGLATSADLLTWHRHGDKPLLEADPRWYEILAEGVWHEQAWRDPWVFRDPVTGTFHAMITARLGRGPSPSRGVVAHATSADLLQWTVHPPVTGPGPFVHLEIPQVATVDGVTFLIFSAPAGTGLPVQGTHALRSGHATGPYDWSTHHIVDADATGSRYGGRLVATPTGWQLLTWLGPGPDGVFRGELAEPVAVTVSAGHLRAGGG